MQSVRLTLKNASGLHVRPAGLLVHEAKKFTSKLTIRKGSKTANCKGIMGILVMEARAGDEVEIIAEGPDEAEAVQALADLIENRLAE